jgi:hypothetical protein
MSERQTVERVKERQGVFAKIQNIFTMGYGTKEDLRELDKKLRDCYYDDFRNLRHRWEEIYLSALNSGQQSIGDHFKKVIQVLDRVAEKVNRADYGYAGFFDRKGSIRENELAHIFNYDKALEGDIRSLIEAVDELHGRSEADEWSDAEAKVKNIKSLILSLESKWNKREKEFRPLEM